MEQCSARRAAATGAASSCIARTSAIAAATPTTAANHVGSCPAESAAAWTAPSTPWNPTSGRAAPPRAERGRGKRRRDVALAGPTCRHRYEGSEQDEIGCRTTDAVCQRARHDELETSGAPVDPGADAPRARDSQHSGRKEGQRDNDRGKPTGHRRSQLSASTSAGTSGTATARPSAEPGQAVRPPPERCRSAMTAGRPRAATRASADGSATGRAAQRPPPPARRRRSSPTAAQPPLPRRERRGRARRAAPRHPTGRVRPAARCH